MTEPNSSRIPQRLLGLFHATALLAVAACGGNGSGTAGAPISAPPPAPAPGPAAAAAGLYVDTSVVGRVLSTLVVDSGRFYQFYNDPLAGAGVVGVRLGLGTLVSSSFSSSDVRDFAIGTGLLSGTGTLSATLGPTPGTFNGSIVRGSSTVTFASSASTVHDTPVPLTTLSTGPFLGRVAFGASNESASLTISPSGVLGANTSPSACSLSGTATPSTSVNVMDVSITFSGGCGTALNGKTLTGNGYFAAPQLLIAVSDANQVVLIGATR